MGHSTPPCIVPLLKNFIELYSTREGILHLSRDPLISFEPSFFCNYRIQEKAVKFLTNCSCRKSGGGGEGSSRHLNLLLKVLQVRQYSNLSWEYNFANSGS